MYLLCKIIFARSKRYRTESQSKIYMTESQSKRYRTESSLRDMGLNLLAMVWYHEFVHILGVENIQINITTLYCNP